MSNTCGVQVIESKDLTLEDTSSVCNTTCVCVCVRAYVWVWCVWVFWHSWAHATVKLPLIWFWFISLHEIRRNIILNILNMWVPHKISVCKFNLVCFYSWFSFIWPVSPMLCIINIRCQDFKLLLYLSQSDTQYCTSCYGKTSDKVFTWNGWTQRAETGIWRETGDTSSIFKKTQQM